MLQKTFSVLILLFCWQPDDGWTADIKENDKINDAAVRESEFLDLLKRVLEKRMNKGDVEGSTSVPTVVERGSDVTNEHDEGEKDLHKDREEIHEENKKHRNFVVEDGVVHRESDKITDAAVRESEFLDLLKRVLEKRVNEEDVEGSTSVPTVVESGSDVTDDHDEVEKDLHKDEEEIHEENKKHRNFVVEDGVVHRLQGAKPWETNLPSEEGDPVTGDAVLTHMQKVELGLESETPEEELEAVQNKGKKNLKRKLSDSKDGSSLWPNGIIPWQFKSGDLGFRNRSYAIRVKEAIAHLEENTCLKFPYRGTYLATTVDHGNYIEVKSGPGCWAYVSMVNRGAQTVNLQTPTCLNLGTIVHEFGHAIGLFHEHVRSDRDEHTKIYFENISPNYEKNFKRVVSYNYAPYDLESIMQYGRTFFSANGKSTIKTKDPDLSFLIDPANREGLTFYDIMAITHAYDCAAVDKCPRPLKTCQNSGFVGHKCQCICPSGLRAPDCADVDKTLSPDCGGTINLEVGGSVKTFASPHYEGRIATGKCIWFIKAPTDQYIVLSFEEFDLAQNTYPEYDLTICVSAVEIRYNLIGQTGPRFCGSNMGNKIFSTETRIPSRLDDMNKMMVIFEGAERPVPEKGFRAIVRSFDIPGCRKKTCLNGGICYDGGTKKAVCKCALGFIGGICEIVGYKIVFTNFDDSNDNKGMGFFANVADGDQLDWTRNEGPTPSDKTGPSAAVGGTGYYLYLEASAYVLYATARLETVVLFQNRERCVSFYYSMVGQCTGTLEVKQVTVSGTELSLWKMEGEQPSEWTKQYVKVPKITGQYKLVFEATKDFCFASDIAIDEVAVYPITCNQVSISRGKMATT